MRVRLPLPPLNMERIMDKNFTVANRVRLEGAVPFEELREEIVAFRDRWHIPTKDLAVVLGIPLGTLDSIINENKSKLVLKETAHRVRSSIRNYDSRTCIYRRLPKSDVEATLRKIKAKHSLTWGAVSRVVDYPESKIRQIVSEKSSQRYVPVEVVRSMLLSYNDFLKERANALRY